MGHPGIVAVGEQSLCAVGGYGGDFLRHGVALRHSFGRGVEVDAQYFRRLPFVGAPVAFGSDDQHFAHSGVGAHALKFDGGYVGDGDNVLEVFFQFGPPLFPTAGVGGG